MISKLSWTFPLKEFFFMKIEVFFIAILALLVFLFSFPTLGWLFSVLTTLVFLVVYTLISYGLQKWRKPIEEYHLTTTHLHVTRRSRNKSQSHKIPLKNIKHHKLNKFFLGGYLLTKDKKKHLLFFNTKKELLAFEKFLKKHSKTIGKKK